MKDSNTDALLPVTSRKHQDKLDEIYLQICQN